MVNVKVCPKCGSVNIVVDGGIGLGNPTFTCNDCGFKDLVFLEKDLDKETIPDKQSGGK